MASRVILNRLGNHIAGFQGADCRVLPVDLNAAFGSNVTDGPAAVIIPGQNGVAPGDCRQVDDNVAAFVSSITFSQCVIGSWFPSGRQSHAQISGSLRKVSRLLAQRRRSSNAKMGSRIRTAVQYRLKTVCFKGKTAKTLEAFKKIFQMRSLPFRTACLKQRLFRYNERSNQVRRQVPSPH